MAALAVVEDLDPLGDLGDGLGAGDKAPVVAVLDWLRAVNMTRLGAAPREVVSKAWLKACDAAEAANLPRPS